MSKQLTRCSTCANYMTDHCWAFTEKLNSNGPKRCFECHKKTLYKLKENAKKKIRPLAHLLPFIVFAISMLFTDNIYSNDILMTLNIIVYSISVLIIIVKNYYPYSVPPETGEREFKGSHFESTIKSDGTIITKEVEEYSDDGHAYGLTIFTITVPIVFFTFFIWSIPHLLYLIATKYISQHKLNTIYSEVNFTNAHNYACKKANIYDYKFEYPKD